MNPILLRILMVLALFAGYAIAGTMDYEDAQNRPGKTQHQIEWEAAHEN